MVAPSEEEQIAEQLKTASLTNSLMEGITKQNLNPGEEDVDVGSESSNEEADDQQGGNDPGFDQDDEDDPNPSSNQNNAPQANESNGSNIQQQPPVTSAGNPSTTGANDPSSVQPQQQPSASGQPSNPAAPGTPLPRPLTTTAASGLRRSNFVMPPVRRIQIKKFMDDDKTPRCQAVTQAGSQCTYSEERCQFHIDNKQTEREREENARLKRQAKQAENRAVKKQRLQEERDAALVKAHNALGKVARINNSLRQSDDEFKKAQQDLMNALK